MRIVIPIEPKAKESIRFNSRGHAFLSPSYRAFRTKFMVLCRRAYREDPFSVPISVSVRFYFKPPKRPKFKHYHAVKPDLDNFVKSLDAATGILWKDDALIFDLHATKLYDWTGEARIEIEIMPYGEIKCGAI